MARRARARATPARRGLLQICATPIGNLEDVTLRVLRALAEADLIACEDTRRTRVLLERHGIDAARLISYHEHNERSRAAELAERIAGGDVVALVTDAGTPLISDPGWALVRACIDADLPVQALPGASAVVTALAVSGVAGERFTFVGFLPRRAGERERLWRGHPETLVAFESPRRLAASLAALAVVDPQRRVAVCRELTKLHEEVVRGTAADLAARYADAEPRGEIVLVAGPADAQASGAEIAPALDALTALVKAGVKPRVAARVLAGLTGHSANELYAAHAGARRPPAAPAGND
jgi:16S rRNA (cytidine1402-2'-O)-methyltransferase